MNTPKHNMNEYKYTIPFSIQEGQCNFDKTVVGKVHYIFFSEPTFFMVEKTGIK